ncbi:MAG: integrase catalytic subunit [Gammaproteobacteria bacterium]|nr:integrase catalytic subunit [Gammaproteobacteria bacterium]
MEAGRRRCKAARPRSALGYRPPAPEIITAPGQASGSAALRPLPGLAAAPARH